MNYSMIGKYEKAKMYAQERGRFQFEAFQLKIDGDHNPHKVKYEAGTWECDCDFFQGNGRCSHTMATEKVLEDMVELS